MTGFWSAMRLGGANYMMLPNALYPTDDRISIERFREMRQFCLETFGGSSTGPHAWLSSHISKSFAFKSEADRIVFRMAFPEG